MEEIIKKLIEVDKAARQRVEKAEAERDSLALKLSLKKEDILSKVKNDFSRQLAENKQSAERELVNGFSPEELACRTEEVNARMDSLFSQKKDEWVNLIFERTIG